MKNGHKFGVDPARIRRWLKDKQKIQEMALKNPKINSIQRIEFAI